LKRLKKFEAAVVALKKKTPSRKLATAIGQLGMKSESFALDDKCMLVGYKKLTNDPNYGGGLKRH